jgi:hypothetical protein
VYKQAELKPDAGNKGKLLTLLRLFDSEEPTRKKFIGEMIGYVEPIASDGIAELMRFADGPQRAANTRLANQIYIMLRAPCMLRNTTHTMQKDTLF